MAVKKGTTSTTQRLPSGIHQVASRAKDMTPVPTKTRRFEKAKTTLAPFIKQEDRGDDQIEVVDVTAALQWARDVDVTAALQRARDVDVTAAIKTLKDLGVSSAKIEEAQKAIVEIEEAQKAVVEDVTTSHRPDFAVPVPAVRAVPKPGEKFTVPEDIKEAEKQARSGVMIGTAGLSDREGGFIGSAAPSAIAKQAGVAQAVAGVETGELTPDEARDYIDVINEMPASGPLSDAAYLVPGLGSYKSYKDAVNAGWDPISTGMFITSTALDVILFVSPAKVGRLPGNILRIPKTGPLAATGTYSPTSIPSRQVRTITQTVLSPTEKQTLADLLKTATTERKLTIPPRAPLEIPPLQKELFKPLTQADVKTTNQITRKATGLHESLDRPLAPGNIETPRAAPRGIETQLNTARSGLTKKTADNLRASESLEDLLNNPVYTRLVPDITQTRDQIAKHENAVQEVQKVITTIQNPVSGIHQINDTQAWKQIKILLDGLDESETRLNNDIKKVIERVNKQDNEILTSTPSKTKSDTKTDSETKTKPAPDEFTTPGDATEQQLSETTRPALDEFTGTESATEQQPSETTRPAPDEFTTTGVATEQQPGSKFDTSPFEETQPQPGGGQAKQQPQPAPVTSKITDPFTGPGGGPAPQPKPKPEKPKPQETKTRGKGLPDFELPKGKRLPKGFFPKTVSWPQGAVQITYDLATGRTTYKGRTPDKKSPRDGFRVTQITRTPPPPRVLDMGVTDALVTTGSIRFRRSKTYRKDRTFKRSRGRL